MTDAQKRRFIPDPGDAVRSQRREVRQGISGAIHPCRGEEARAIVDGCGQCIIAGIGIGTAVSQPRFGTRFQYRMDAVGCKRSVRGVFPRGPAHNDGIHTGRSAQSDVHVKRARTAVALTAMDFVVAGFAIEVYFDARAYGGSIGRSAFQSEANEMSVGVQVFKDLKSGLGGRAAGSDGEVPVPVAVQIPRCEPIIAVVVFQHHIPFAHPSKCRVAEPPVQAVRRRSEGVVIDDVEVRFGVVVVIEKDAAPRHA